MSLPSSFSGPHSRRKQSSNTWRDRKNVERTMPTLEAVEEGRIKRSKASGNCWSVTFQPLFDADLSRRRQIWRSQLTVVVLQMEDFADSPRAHRLRRPTTRRLHAGLISITRRITPYAVVLSESVVVHQLKQAFDFTRNRIFRRSCVYFVHLHFGY